ALLGRHDEPMNSRFRAQLQRFFHFVKRRGHPRLLQPLMNETQQHTLLFRGRRGLQSTAPIRRRSTVRRITILAKTNREQALVVHALFGKRNLRNLWPWSETGAKPPPLLGGRGLARAGLTLLACLPDPNRVEPHGVVPRSRRCDRDHSRIEDLRLFVFIGEIAASALRGSRQRAAQREYEGLVLFAGQKPYPTWRQALPPPDHPPC